MPLDVFCETDNFFSFGYKIRLSTLLAAAVSLMSRGFGSKAQNVSLKITLKPNKMELNLKISQLFDLNNDCVFLYRCLLHRRKEKNTP